ncbi:ribosome maturation factor RimP [Rhodohalobacter sp. 614A]|uniref:ribosome maturation factor RimP n=1 Tax=Rhodohalobacter sp. 614A TaxID=2908649 RepID=UPI001F40F524|nr:ribosome maturation factor [Rhodohalobacter sp. 614A]
MQNESINKIKEIAYPIVEQGDAFLVDVEIKHQKVPEVWILVDSESGNVSLDTYSAISRRIGDALDEEDIFQNKYRLNVSSPGLSRPLSDKRQYAKNQGRVAKVKYKEQDQYQTVEGVIKQVEKDKISINTEDGDVFEILFEDIVETKIVPKI